MGQLTVGTTPVRIVLGRGRKSIVIRNTHASVALFVGIDNKLKITNGHSLAFGQSLEMLGYSGEVWAAAASGEINVTWIEW